MAYPFQPLDTEKLKRFWDVLLYKKETNRKISMIPFIPRNKLTNLRETNTNPSNKSPIYRPQRQRKI